MSNFRQRIETLPFVGRNADNSLNYWNVTGTGNREVDVGLGRVYAARALHFYKAFDAPHLAARIFSASMRDPGTNAQHLSEGFVLETRDYLLAAPQCATVGLQTARALVRGAERRHFLDLPFVRRNRASGEIDLWAVKSSGCWSRDTATGRHYGALTAEFVRRSKCIRCVENVAASIAARPALAEETCGVWTGWVTEIASIAMHAPAATTLHQEATLPFHRAALGQVGA